MNTPAKRAVASWPGLLEKLIAVVRAEFRVDLLVPDPDHPVLGRGVCPVNGCDRSPTGNGLCSSHQKRWLDRGRPELAAFLADPGPPLNGRRDLTAPSRAAATEAAATGCACVTAAPGSPAEFPTR